MKKWILSLFLSGTVLVGLVACNEEGKEEDTKDNSEVLVEFEGGTVTKDELYNEMKVMFGEQALNTLVQEKVLDANFDVSEEKIDEEVAPIKEQFGENFEAALQQNGFKSEEEFRRAVRLDMLRQEAAKSQIEISDEDLKKYYEEEWGPPRNVRHILVEDEKTAKEVKEKLEAGGDFAELAKEYSTDPGSKEKGGDLGEITVASNMVEPFKKAAFNLKVNEISEPVKSQFGFHVIEVTKAEEKPAFEDAKEDVLIDYQQTHMDPASIQAAVDKLLEEAKIDVKEEDFKDLF